MSNKRNWASLLLLLCLVASLLVFPNTGNVSADTGHRFNSPHFTLVTDANGRQLVRAAFPAKPPAVKMPVANPPEGTKSAASASATSPNVRSAGTTTILADVPAFYWSYGCSPTAAAMLFGYYDRIGYNNMYTGTVNGGVSPLNNSAWGSTPTGSECAISATHLGVDNRTTRGHVDDYWIAFDSTGPDPYVTDNVSEHSLDCTADFMGTSQWKYETRDGTTYFYYNHTGDPLYDFTELPPGNVEVDGCHGMRLYAESRGYTVVTNYTQLIQGQGNDPAKGFTFANFQAEINAGRPVLIQVYEHTMLGYGYDTATSNIYVHDTWDHEIHTMQWGRTYGTTPPRQQWAVTVIQLQALPPPAAPTLISPAAGASITGTSVTFTWNASAGAVNYWLYAAPSGGGAPIYNQPVGNVTSQVVNGFPNNGTQYNWTVAAGNSAGWSPAAAARTFTSGAPLTIPAAPALSSPGVDATVNATSINFQWAAATGAANYWLAVVRNSDNALVISQAVGNVTVYNQGGFPNNGSTYRWTVAAGNSAGWGPAATWRNFTNGATPVTVPAAPALSSPAVDAAVNATSINFQWAAPAGAVNYWLAVVRNSDNAIVISQPVGNVISYTQGGFPNNGATYRWTVAAGNSAGWGPAASWRNFTNGATPVTIPAAPALSSPAVDASVNATSINFQWAASAGAVNYWLAVVRNSDNAIVISQPVGNVISYTQGGFPNNGTTYRWTVAAGNSAGWSPAAAWRNFTNSP